jgi:hypothetical protein
MSIPMNIDQDRRQSYAVGAPCFLWLKPRARVESWDSLGIHCTPIWWVARQSFFPIFEPVTKLVTAPLHILLTDGFFDG